MEPESITSTSNPRNDQSTRRSVRKRHVQIACVAVIGIVFLVAITSSGLGSRLSGGSAYLPWVPREWPTLTPTPALARLIISEVMFDPEIVEPDGEWFELFNSGDFELVLNGYKVGDEETAGQGEGMYRLPQGLILGPRQALVIANRAEAFRAQFQASPDYELRESDPGVPDLEKYTDWSTGYVELLNAGDELIVLNADNWVVDGVSWGSSRTILDPPALRVAEGHSLSRRFGYSDNDLASDWIDQPAPNPWIVDMNTPTPTATFTPRPTGTATSTPTPTPPAAGIVLISEVFYHSATIADPMGEWIEIYNNGSQVMCLGGFKVGDEEYAGGSEGMVAFPDPACLAPESVFVVAHASQIFQTVYGFPADFEFVDSDPDVPDMIDYAVWGAGSVSLNNTGDEVLLLDRENHLLDAVSWGTSNWAFDPPVPVVADDHSMERYPPNQDTNSNVDWRDQSLPAPGIVDNPEIDPLTPSPTPSRTPTATLPYHLVVNEILAYPPQLAGDANGDGEANPVEDEFIEIVNTTLGEIDLSGWQLGDALLVRHIFPAGTHLSPGGAIVVFGGGNPLGDFGGSLVQVASSGQLGLDNYNDSVRLLDPVSAQVLVYSYGPEAGDGQSVTRSPDIYGQEPLIKHTTASGAAGALFSPGCRVDGTPF
jgi:hypothetical protein